MAKANKSQGNASIIAAAIFIIAIILIFSYTISKNNSVVATQTTNSTISPAGSTTINYSSSNATINVSCLASNSNYTCNAVSYNQTSATLRLGLLQNTGINWTNVSIAFIPQDAGVSSPGAALNPYFNNNSTNVGNMPGSLGFTCPPNADCARPIEFANLRMVEFLAYGAVPVNGSVWVKYQLAAGGVPYYAQFGNLTFSSS